MPTLVQFCVALGLAAAAALIVEIARGARRRRHTRIIIDIRG